ncbi:hypothetical protein FBY39_2436 [Microbacterium sp. SLBN-146]|nr:hypothetical protein FBY39_2436 [Microbacterium sp. SLBN-146]
MQIDVFKSREMLATIYAIRALDKTLQKQIRTHVKRWAQPEFKQSMAQHADTKLEHRVLVDTAVVSVSNQNVRLQSAGKGRRLSGGLNPKTDYAPVEFGAHAKGKSYTRKSRNGGTHRVMRAMNTQFKVPNRRGYVFYPTVREFVPRVASYYVQTTVRTIANALEGKQE